jgi:hypothetical protein
MTDFCTCWAAYVAPPRNLRYCAIVAWVFLCSCSRTILCRYTTIHVFLFSHPPIGTRYCECMVSGDSANSPNPYVRSECHTLGFINQDINK